MLLDNSISIKEISAAVKPVHVTNTTLAFQENIIRLIGQLIKKYKSEFVCTEITKTAYSNNYRKLLLNVILNITRNNDYHYQFIFCIINILHDRW